MARLYPFQISILLGAIFLLGVLARFMYFPNNIHFAFDQARDAFAALDLAKGDIKIIGPPSAASDSLFPGPLVYYIHAPVLMLFNNSPEALSAFGRIYNAAGIILVFLIGAALFSKRVGILASLLFAVSYEQSQYALFISHQPLTVLPILILYLGISLVIVKRNYWGITLAALGWGLAIQFHYVYILVAPVLLTIAVLFRKTFLFIPWRHIAASIGVFLLTISTYFISEILFGFRFLSGSINTSHALSFHPKAMVYALNRFFYDTFIAEHTFTLIGMFIFVGSVIYIWVHQKSVRSQLLLLILWFNSGLIPYLLTGTPSYYYSAASSVSLLIFSSYIINQLISKNYSVLGIIVLGGIVFNNLHLITKYNKSGPNTDIVIQQGMFLSNQKQALDYVYEKAQGQPFAINALTIPLNVNTTWSYLFEWYGKQKYGYVPIWGGDAAQGYAGNLKVITARSELPEKRFIIIEPTVGIRKHDKERFLQEESYFTNIIESKKFGAITVQSRSPL